MTTTACKPVAPVRPLSPRGPKRPVRPVGPVTPVAPVNPREPVTPVGPVAPVAPWTPGGPIGPNKLIQHKLQPLDISKEVDFLFVYTKGADTIQCRVNYYTRCMFKRTRSLSNASLRSKLTVVGLS